MGKIFRFFFDNFKKENTLPKNFGLFTIGLEFFAAFLLAMFLEFKQITGPFDFNTTVLLQSIIPRILDTPLSVFSLIGSFEIITVTLGLLLLYIYRKEKRIFYPLGLFFMILVFEFIGKLFVYHPNPPHDFFRYDLPFSFPTSGVQTGNSFPSGHVSRTAFLAVVTAVIGSRFTKNRFLKLGIFLFLVVMVASRVYLGEHWASDTIGGLFLGAAMGFFAVSYF